MLVALAASGMLGAEGAIIAALLHNLSTFLGVGNAGRLLLFDEPFSPSGAETKPSLHAAVNSATSAALT